MSYEYDEFLQTVEWKEVSSKMKHEHEDKCELCGSPKNLDVHHIVYSDNLTDEGKLIVLCHNCHECTERMINRFKIQYNKSRVMSEKLIDHLFEASLTDYFQNSFYAIGSQSQINAFDTYVKIDIVNFMEYQVKARFPNIEVAKGMYVRDFRRFTSLYAFRNLTQWRNDLIRKALDDGFSKTAIMQRFRMSEQAWYKAMKRINESR